MATDEIRYLNSAQARAIDRLAIEKLGIPSVVLMENAARGCAEWLLAEAAALRTLIFCGPGNNGGDGLAMGRHLANAGCQVLFVVVADPTRLSVDACTNLHICNRMKLPVEVTSLADPQASCRSCASVIAGFRPDVIVDALLGTGIRGAPQGAIGGAVLALNDSGMRVIALDVPTGWDTDRGCPTAICIRAANTLTMVAPKLGFDRPESRDYVGTWTAIGIGAPQWLVAEAMK